MDVIYCQSCGMSMTLTEHYGTNADGTANTDYCAYCYNEGEFTDDLSMDEMIEQCLDMFGDFDDEIENNAEREEAKEKFKEHFPKLKRWKKD